MTAPKMKPCPICDQTDRLAVYTYDNGGRHVECTRCNYLGPACTSIVWAIKDHNAEREARVETYAKARELREARLAD